MRQQSALLRLSLLLALSTALVHPVRANGEQAVSRIAFGACLHQNKPQPLWDDVLESNPDLFIFCGDNGYIDTDTPERFPLVYDQLNANEGIQALRKACTVLGTWDDHDYGRNDFGKTYPLKEVSKKAFSQFFELPPEHPVHSHGGVYQSYTYGPKGQRLQVILLDTRWFRDNIIRDKRTPEEKKAANTVGWYVPHTDTTPTLLGSEQWDWLEEQLKQEADVVFW